MITFIKGIFSSGTPESSKRVFGAIGFVWSGILITMYAHDLIFTFFITSCTLLGLETLTSLITKK